MAASNRRSVVGTEKVLTSLGPRGILLGPRFSGSIDSGSPSPVSPTGPSWYSDKSCSPLTWGSSWKGHSRIQTADLKAGPAHGSAGENLSSSRRTLLFLRFCSTHCPSHLTLVTGVLRHVGGTQQCFLTCVWVSDLLQNFMEIDSPPPKWMQTFLHATLMESYIAIHLVNKYLNGVCQAQF